MKDWTMRVLAAAACLGATVAATVAVAHEVRDLAGSEWAPAEVAGGPLPDGVEVFVQFGAEGRVAGSSGCNRFTGTFNQDGHELKLGPLAATRMACPPPRSEVEQAVLEALGRVAHVEEPEPGRLTLFDADGDVLMLLVQRDRD